MGAKWKMDELFLFSVFESITEIKIKNPIILFIGCSAHFSHVGGHQQQNTDSFHCRSKID